MIRAAAIITAIAAALVGGFAALASPDGGEPPVFEIVNDTDKAVEQLSFRPTGARVAPEDLLGRVTLPPGGWAEVPVEPARGCRYELQADTGLASIRSGDIDVCATHAFRLSQGVRVPLRFGWSELGDRIVPAPPTYRGVPICPGDVRCRKKK